MLPQMTDQFERFIAPARRAKGGWRLFGGICLLTVLYIVFSLLILGLFALWMVDWQLKLLLGHWRDAGAVILDTETPLGMIVALSTFAGMFLAAFLTVRLVHNRGIRSLVGSGPVVRNFLLTAGVVVVLAGVGSLVNLLATDLESNLPPSQWLAWLSLGLPLLLLQTSSEELVFRGYVLQELATRFKNRWIWLSVSTAVFGLLHFDPDRFGPNAWLVVGAASLLGFVATDLTIRTGNLGAAIGLHFANNFFAMFVISLGGTLTGLSLYTTQFSVDQTEEVCKLLLLDIGSILLVYTIYLVVLYAKRRRQLHSTNDETM